MTIYLSTEVLYTNSFNSLFIKPYSEGIKNIKKAFKPLPINPDANADLSYLLAKRVKHFIVGVCLIIPVLNTITVIFLRMYLTDEWKKIEKVVNKQKEQKSVDVGVERPSIPVDHEQICRMLDKNLSKKDQEAQFIKIYIEFFLDGFITGKITRDNEPKNRTSLIEDLNQILGKYQMVQHNDLEVIAIAGKEYVYRSLVGFFRYFDEYESLALTQEKKEILLKALCEAFPKDFPCKNLTDDKIKEFLSEEIDLAYSHWKEEFTKAKVNQGNIPA